MLFGPYPGSADFQALVDAGRLEVDEAYLYTALSWSSGHHRSYNPRIGKRLLRLTQLAMLCTFYGVTSVLRPRRVLGHLRALFGAEESTSLDALIRSKRRGYARTDPEDDPRIEQHAA
jgi:hypothetical protein